MMSALNRVLFRIRRLPQLPLTFGRLFSNR